MASRWIPFVALLWEFQCCVCREVTLPAGPLYRVAGFSLSLPCAVSGYEGPRTQDFEWYLYREDAGGRQIGVVSTRDAGFPYAPFQSRVQAGEVRVERDSGDKARLIIQRLRPDDQGRYECYTPSTDTRFLGNYSSSVVVKEVRVSASIDLPRRPLLKRGSTVTLLCNVSVEATGASRVEVQWLQTPEEPARKDPALSEDSGRLLLATLSYDGLTRIYSNGSDLSVDRVSAGCFRLRIFSAAEEDQGHYQCRAQVWAQDPRGGWYSTGAEAQSVTVHLYLYARVTDLLLLPLVIGVSSALFVGILIIATVTCCFMSRLARQRSRIRK
ncbi:hypothetical protein cypCar_00041242 [Cyprinus carpio]|nr:hypothetical protein cypCar_00041242 [Cyprinus carpio]